MKRILSFILAALMITTALAAGMTVSAGLSFNDTDGHWATEAIEYVVENGLMNGVGNGESFAPNMSLTRGMVVTVLYRDNGSPKQNFKGTFLDVADGAYYTAAAEWAFENEIVNGTGTDEWGVPYFSPDRDITRQELATMFKRYADFKHVDTAKGAADISSFPDAASVADWASDAVKWAVGVGLITGKSNGGAATLSPVDKAVRAEFATIIKRFKEADFEYLLVYNSPVYNAEFTKLPYTKVEDADVYVAVDGNDTNSGTKDKPLATFTAANAKVEELKKTAKDEIVVAFKAGNYGELNYIGIASGTEKVPVKYCAYGDGEVIFSNGIEIKLSDFMPLDENDLKFLDGSDTANIKKVDLTGKLDSFSSRTRLFSNNGICYEARFPNKNGDGSNFYYTNLTTTHDERSSILVKGALPKIINGFKNIEFMKVTGYLRTGWLVDTFPVKSFDPATNILTFDFESNPFDNGFTLDSFPLMYEGRTDDMVFFHNLPDQLDDEGEYFFNEKTKILYVYAPESDHAIATGGGMIRANVNYTSFVGLTFMCTTDTAMGLDGDHNTVDRCTFKYISGNQCIMSFRANYLTVENSEFSNFACGGVVSQGGGDMLLLKDSHNVIRNNYFHDFGSPEFFSGADGIGVQNSVGTVVEHNLLVRGAHGGIVFNGTIKCDYRYNILDNMVNNTQDYGAIYGGGKALRGNKICYNLIMNTGKGAAYGIYVDECGAGQEIFGNIFFNAGAHAVTLNGGRENNIHDNICINTDGADLLMSNSGMYGLILDGTPELGVEHQTYTHLIAERAPVDSEGYDIWYKTFPEVYDFNIDPDKVGDPDCLFTTINFLRNNIIIGSEIKYGETFDKFGVNEGNSAYSLDVNNWFVDPTHGDYRFKTGVSFADIDFDKIGIQY